MKIMGHLPYQLVIAGFLNHQQYLDFWKDRDHPVTAQDSSHLMEMITFLGDLESEDE